ncbi:MAG TPA: adenylyltransferase/cytidyltransferase family protein, partial [Cryomorphaceae bacterium]|nr:adenylyltransferase/cytidyltransferase family protein [Cryomorphaceae bacterium]
MEVYRDVSDFHPTSGSIVTVGTFDGVHIGHRTILERIKELAKEQGGESVLLTFWPHPRLVLFPDDNELKLLSTLEDRIELLEQSGIDHLIIHPFSLDFSRITALEYVRDI